MAKDLYKLMGVEDEADEEDGGKDLYDLLDPNQPLQQPADPQWEEDRPLLPGEMRQQFYSALRKEYQPDSATMNSAPQGSIVERMIAGVPAVAGEISAAANRNVAGLVDTFPNAINAGMRYAGSERRVPTLRGSLPGIEGGFMQPGMARDIVQGIGGNIPAAAGLVPIARPAATVGSMALDFLGVGATKGPSAVIDAATTAAGFPTRVDDAARQINFRRQQPRRVEPSLDLSMSLKRRDGNALTVPLRMDEAGIVFRDPIQKAAQTQGVDDRVIAMVRDATPQARARMNQMLDIVEGSTKNAKFESLNRPGDVVGESLTMRTRMIAAANRLAGQQINSAAKALKGKSVDVSPVMRQLEEDLASMGIERSVTDTNFRFDASDIDGLAEPTRVINNFLDQLRKRDGTDAYVVHQMKRWIDEQVSWGKAGSGLTGRVENILKSFRRGIDQVLDTAEGPEFAEYNRVNTMYSETISALDALQTAAGKRIDLTGANAETALGTLSRRVLGNAVSRQDLAKGMEVIDDMAKRLASGEMAGNNLVPYRRSVLSDVARVKPEDLDDGLIEQIRFVSQLEELFGTNAKNSFLGENLKAAERVAESVVSGDKTGPLREGYRFLRSKAKGINEENALKALRELVK